MVNAYDVVLPQRFVQADFVHPLTRAADDADFIAEIVRFLDIGQIFGVFVKKVSLGKSSIEGFFESLPIFLPCPSIQRGSIARRHVGDIGRFLHPPLNLERIQRRQILNVVDGIQILGGQQVADTQRFPARLVEQLIGLAAGADTSAPVAAAIADQSGHQTVAGIGHAERAMHEDFQWNFCLAPNCLRLFDFHLARQHHTLRAKFFPQQRAFEVIDAHLR